MYDALGCLVRFLPPTTAHNCLRPETAYNCCWADICVGFVGPGHLFAHDTMRP